MIFIFNILYIRFLMKFDFFLVLFWNLFLGDEVEVPKSIVNLGSGSSDSMPSDVQFFVYFGLRIVIIFDILRYLMTSCDIL